MQPGESTHRPMEPNDRRVSAPFVGHHMCNLSPRHFTNGECLRITRENPSEFIFRRPSEPTEYRVSRDIFNRSTKLK